MLKRFKSFLLVVSLFLSFLFSGTLFTCAKGGKKAVVYVTSMLSSGLFDVKEKNKALWLDSILGFLWDPNAVGCDEDGNSVNKNILALNSVTGIEDEGKKDLIKYGVYGCDKKIMDTLTKELGPGTEYNVDIVRFAYDWRKSCEEISEGLLRIVDEYDSVCIVSYSQGGIVVCSAIDKLLSKGNFKTLNKIENYIFVAVPFYGTVEPWFVFENGIRMDGFLSKIASFIGVNKITKNLARNFKSMYEMLPTEEYFSLLKNKKKDVKRIEDVTSVDSYSEMAKTIKRCNWYEKKNKNKKDFLFRAKNVKDKLSKNVYKYIASNDKSSFICGTGIDTLYKLGYNKDKNLVISEVAPGDYGIVYNSTFPVGTDASKIFPVEGIRHTEMVNSDVVLGKILKILKDKLVKV